jgi:hypothetical protein
MVGAYALMSRIKFPFFVLAKLLVNASNHLFVKISLENVSFY